ncbi:DEAD/DEAH box helicase [Brevibacterium luteolum]|uniref:DEAD/DEAH box helicase n=1 Tax=Brevibacterium luteolum TaxID=199591 RepID=UPI00387A0A09
MSQVGLLPTFQAASIRRSLSEYLTTTFSLADRAAQQALDDFLTDPSSGIFTGPFVRTRTPFEPVADAQNALDIVPGKYRPYGHQAEAFRRLSSRGLNPAERPKPTIVTTGTGSGKTEAFLYPILDHIRRERRAGQSGMSALILYPMNALALDQAQRLSQMLVEDPQFAGIRAGLYVGDSGDSGRSMVTADGLITDRETLRAEPPDILLTNYKMLDRLLLRPADQGIFDASALSLQYLVLDEFHTYDGAQGTDVAMLLRRLGAALKRRWPESHPKLTDEHRTRPLGRITPVGTSATLGDEGDPTALIEFADAVFGERIGTDAVVTESRYTVEEWTRLTFDPLSEPHPDLIPGFSVDDLAYQDIASIPSDDAVHFIFDSSETSLNTIVRTAVTLLTTQDRWPELSAAVAESDFEPQLMAELLRHHPSIQQLAALTVHAQPMHALADRLMTSADYLSAVLALLSHVRAQTGRDALTIDVHMWVRELTRIDRVAGGKIAFRWSDDTVTDADAEATEDWADNEHRGSFPAVFCRNCGRSGWAVLLSPDGHGLDHPDRDRKIRASRFENDERYRVLLSAEGEADSFANSSPDVPVKHPFLHDFRVRQRDLTPPDDAFGPGETNPDLEDEIARGDHLPVLADLTADGGTRGLNDVCPACGERDSIRFLGAAIATLLSVSLSTLFSDSQLPPDEKKSLVFTDSVQDAAHRAGFIEARSHTFTSRSALAAAAAEGPTLNDVADVMLRQAGDDPNLRYRLLAPELTTDRFPGVQRWWRDEGPPLTGKSREGSSKEAMTIVRRRLAFDAALEFGLQNRVGRTLELTGTSEAYVELPPADDLASLTESLFVDSEDQQVGVLPTETERIAWVRGVAEHLRMRGAIHHEWLEQYVAEAGRRYRIWGGRNRGQGMPAFPAGRAAPAFAYTGPSPSYDTSFEKVSDAQGWFARYGAKSLGVSRQHAAVLTVNLLKALALHEGGTAGPVRVTAVLNRQGTAFGLEPARVRLAKSEGATVLACSVCQTDFPMGECARSELTGTPCMLVTCTGKLFPQEVADNFYRRLYTGDDQLRIVAREHSSILDSKARKEVEDGFKRGGSDPSAANVLVATPTLEMGIDIGDLSCVMLSSLPLTVASYVQRVGRAGRQTGNALLLAFVHGYGRQRPMLENPLATIDGAVRPPATFLDAVEIIRRQYIAFLFDILAGESARPGTDELTTVSVAAAEGDYPANASALFRPEVGQSTLLNSVIDLGETKHAELLEQFLEAFGEHIDLAAEELRDWAAPRGNTSGIREDVYRAHRAYKAREEALGRRLSEIQPELDRLATLDENHELAEDDEDDLRQLRSAWRATTNALAEMRRVDWVSALESAQLLPNYTLIDDSVQLDVLARWREDIADEWQEKAITFERGASTALRDFAPGAVYYGSGLQIRIDALDLGVQNEDIHTIAFCPECGYVHTSHDDVHGTEAPTTCPRCGARGISDRGQRIQAVRFRRAMAMVNRDEAGISDREDDRARRMFSLVRTADIDPAQISEQWFTDGYDFGVTYLRQVTITTVNLGTQRRARSLQIAGAQRTASLFTVCAACGVLDRTLGSNSRKDHRPWCHLRDAAEEKTESVALTHELRTQGALLRLPYDLVTGDELMLPSFQAALRLGLRESLGGNPQHIDLLETRQPLESGQTAPAVLVHDTVPGGTGYLADLCRPQKLWGILASALTIVRSCTCRGKQIACASCLLPYAAYGSEDRVSRQSAENTLRALLHGGPAAPDGDLIDDSAAMQWKPTDVPPPSPTPESALESQFLNAFRGRLAHEGYQVSQYASPNGFTELRFASPASDLRWRLLPQELIGDTRPDYLLRCTHPHVPALAIYVDGFTYHATSGHNRVADDARKRAGLKLGGIPAIAVSVEDIRAGQLTRTVDSTVDEAAASREFGTRSGVAGDWMSQIPLDRLSRIRSMQDVTLPDAASELFVNPFELILAWARMIDDTSATGRGRMSAGFAASSPAAQAPVAVEAAAIQAFAASGLPMALAMNNAQWSTEHVLVEPGTSLSEQLADELTGEQPFTRLTKNVLPDSQRAVLHIRDSLGIVIVPGVSIKAALVIDDRSSEITADSFRSSWLRWQHLGSLLNLARETADVAVSSVEAEAEMRRHTVAPPTDEGTEQIYDIHVPRGSDADGSIKVRWQELADGENLLDDERELVTHLAAMGVSVIPEIGYEDPAEGWTIDLAWPEPRIAVVIEPDAELQDAIAAGGWTLVAVSQNSVAAGAAAIETALREATAQGSRTDTETDSPHAADRHPTDKKDS